MSKKPKTPNEIARLKKPERKTASFSLDKKNLEIISEMALAAEVPISELIDEAIRFYLETLQDK